MKNQLLRAYPPLIVLAALVATSGGCGQWRMVDTNAKVHQHTIAGDYDKALATLQAQKNDGYRARDSVLYWMNEGMLLHLAGRYQESIAALQLAEKRSKELFTQSVSRHVAAALTSDGALDYPGEDYESVLLNVIKALDFLALRDHGGALVEARKINRKLEYFNTVYGAEHGNRYREDAFAYWLMGMLFELEGSHDDARIAFRDARRVYRDFGARYHMSEPGYMAEDLARVAIAGGDLELAQALRRDSGDPSLGISHEIMKTHGEVVLIHLNGEGPKKTDMLIRCGYADKQPWRCDHEPGGDYMVPRALAVPSGGTTLQVAFPALITSEPTHAFITMSTHLSTPDPAWEQPMDPYADPGADSDSGPASGSDSGATIRATSEPALPIDRIARETMADKLPRVFRHAVIRAITKIGSKKAAAKANDKLATRGKAGFALGLVLDSGTDLAMNLSEEADKRAWTTLPARLEVARMYVPEGVHDIVLTLPNGKESVIPGVRVHAGERVFLSHRTIL